MHKIRFQLMSLSIIIILITVMPIGFIVDYTVQNALTESYIRSSTEQLSTINEMIKLVQSLTDNGIKMFASDQLITHADDSVTKYLENDKKTVTPSKNGGIEQHIYEKFEHYGKNHPGTLDLYMGTETGGYIQWPEIKTAVSQYDPRKRPWYIAAIKGNGNEVSRTDPYVDLSNGNIIVSYSTPIKDSDGRILGVMATDVSSEMVTNILKGIKIGKTGYCIMIHKSGLMVADSSNPQNNGKYIKDLGIKGLEQILIGKNMQTEININGSTYFVNSIRFEDSDVALASLITTTELYKTSKTIRYTICSVCFITLLVAGVITYIGANKIAKPIVAISDVAQKISDGDLLINVQQNNAKGEIGVLENSMEQMIISLRHMILNTTQAAEQLAASSQELTASSEQSALAANHIAESVSKVASDLDEKMIAAKDASAVMEQMSVGTQKMAENVNEVVGQSTQAANKAKDGSETVDKAISQIIRIEDTVNASAQVVAKLGEQSKEIGQIVDAISGIADQTNLLALNAAIEAARAGEQGRGFAVVAEEVRKLAEQSQKAAKQVAELIQEIQTNTENAVGAMNLGTREVAKGTKVVNEAGIAFREITDLVNQVSERINEISVAIQQTVTGSRQIVSIIKKLDELSKASAGEAQGVSAATEEQLASMEEIASSSQVLKMLAEDMQATVRRFRI